MAVFFYQTSHTLDFAMTNSKFNGGLFHPQLHTRRAQATCILDDQVLLFETESHSFTLDYHEANIRIGGSSGNMLFIENDSKEICF